MRVCETEREREVEKGRRRSAADGHWRSEKKGKRGTTRIECRPVRSAKQGGNERLDYSWPRVQKERKGPVGAPRREAGQEGVVAWHVQRQDGEREGEGGGRVEAGKK